MQLSETSLEQRFFRLLEKLSGAPLEGFPAIWQDLKTAYQQPHRYYHTLQHIDECLQCFARYQKLAEQPLAVEFALWFHDAVYNPKQTDNERQSALWAVKVLRQGQVPDILQQQVYDLIMATAHRQPPKTQDEKLLVDIDLSIFAASPNRFNEYQQQIRAEYGWVEESVYQQKRREVLTRLFNLGDIYYLPEIKTALESAACANLQPFLGMKT